MNITFIFKIWIYNQHILWNITCADDMYLNQCSYCLCRTETKCVVWENIFLKALFIVRRVFRTTWHLLRFCIRYVCTRAERRKTNRPYYIVLWYGMILHDMVCCIMLCYIPGFGFILVIFSWHNIVIHNIVAGSVSFRQVIHLCRERSVFWNIATILVLQFHIKRHIYRPLIVYENIKAVYISDRFYDI